LGTSRELPEEGMQRRSRKRMDMNFNTRLSKWEFLPFGSQKIKYFSALFVPLR